MLLELSIEDLVLIERAGLPGILGNSHHSGMPVLRELGEEHMRTGKSQVCCNPWCGENA